MTARIHSSPRVALLAVLLLSAAGLAPLAAARTMDGSPHARAACDDVTLILITDRNCWGRPGEDGCHGVVIIIASDNNCRGGDGTAGQTAGNGCEDALVVAVAATGNCRGGNG